MPESDPPVHPIRAGWMAARASLVPGLIIQSLMILIALIYFTRPDAAPFFQRIAHWKNIGGIWFSVASTIVAGGILPEIVRVIFFQHGQWRRQNWANLAFSVPYWASQGLTVDLLYRSQAQWFGDDAHFWTIVKKVLVDQLLYNPLFAAPVGVTLYEWKNRGYRWSSQFLTWQWYGTRIFPGLIATWCVWFPVVSVVYCLPQLLQIPIFSLALTFWVTMFTWMSEILAPQTEKPIGVPSI